MEFIILILIVVVFLGLPIMSMRKQSKQINEIKSFQAQLEPGMIVQMTSGIHARITEVGEATVDVEVAPGVTTTWDRSAVLKRVEPLEPEEQPVGGPAAAGMAEASDRAMADQRPDTTFEDFDTIEPFEAKDRETDTGADTDADTDSHGESDGGSSDTPRS